MSEDPEGLRGEIERLKARLADAEITIAKIGFCEPSPTDAQMRYAAKYDVDLGAIEHKTVKPRTK